MWTVDARCPSCSKKETCADRKELISTLSPLTNKLNTVPEFVDGPGDGVLVVACKEFTIA